MPPSFDKKTMQQHRNSADSEFNNKGHRKLRPAQKNEKSGNILEGKNKMLLNDHEANALIDGLNDQHSSNSLDGIDFQKQTYDEHERRSSTQG